MYATCFNSFASNEKINYFNFSLSKEKIVCEEVYDGCESYDLYANISFNGSLLPYLKWDSFLSVCTEYL